MLLATGCEGEYIQASDQGIRITDGSPTGNSRRVTDIDPIVALQEGLPVLYYVKQVGFEQRILKVDNRLSFCYVMSHASKMDKTNILVIPLHQVHIHAHGEALEMCKNQGIVDSNITFDTTVVVETIGRDANGDNENLAEAHVFIAPPWTLLKERLKACSNSKANGQKNKGMEGRKEDEVVPRLDGLRIKEPFQMYMETKALDLEVQFLTPLGHPGGRHLQHRLKLPLQLKQCKTEMARIEDKAYPFSPVDSARVLYVLRELAMTHWWAKNFPRHSEMDFYTYVHQAPVKKRKFDSDDIEEARGRIRGPEVVAQCCQAPALADEDKDDHCKVFLRALLSVLRQSMDLDDDIVRLQEEVRKQNTDPFWAELEQAKGRTTEAAVIANGVQEVVGRAEDEAEEAEEVEEEGPFRTLTRKMSRRMSQMSDQLAERMEALSPGTAGVVRRMSVVSLLSQHSESEQAPAPPAAAAGDEPAAAAPQEEPASCGAQGRPPPHQRPPDEVVEAPPAASLPDRKSYSSRSVDQEESVSAVPFEGRKGVVRASRPTQRNPQAPVLLGSYGAEAIICMSIDEDESSTFVPKEGKQGLVPSFEATVRVRVAPVLLGANLVQDKFGGKAVEEEPAGAAVEGAAAAHKAGASWGLGMTVLPVLPNHLNSISKESMLGLVFGSSTDNTPSTAARSPCAWPWGGK